MRFLSVRAPLVPDYLAAVTGVSVITLHDVPPGALVPCLALNRELAKLTIEA